MIPDWWWATIAVLAALLAGGMTVVLVHGAVKQHREVGHLDTEAPELR